MEDFLETIITVLIGLGVFLISAFRKRKSAKGTNAAEDQEINDFFSDEKDQYYTDEADMATAVEENKYNMSDSENKKENTVMPEEFSANDPPDQEKRNPVRTLYNSPGKNSKSKAVMQQSKKQGFNARKAIIYATIINRKYS